MKVNNCLKRIKKAIEFSMSKDETRPFLNGWIHYEKLKALVSCNGFVLTCSQSLYDDNLKNIIISPKEYQSVQREYPRVEAVIPDLSKLESGVVQIKKVFKVKGKEVVKLYLYKDDDNFHFSFEEKENAILVIDARNIAPLTDDCSYEFKYSKKLNPIVFNLSYGETFNDYFLLLPLKV